MKRKIAINNRDRAIIVAALVAYDCLLLAGEIQSQFLGADPTNDGPEIEILSVERTTRKKISTYPISEQYLQAMRKDAEAFRDGVRPESPSGAYTAYDILRLLDTIDNLKRDRYEHS